MGITEMVAALMPRRGERHEKTSREDALALHDDFDRWLQRFFEEPFEFPTRGEARGMPSAEVRETDDEVVVRTEVPGLDKEDLELTIFPDGLTIRGQRQEEKKARAKDLVEWRYGSFVQTVPLPPGIDVEHADAKMKNGVLTVRLPKLHGPRPGARRIPVKR